MWNYFFMLVAASAATLLFYDDKKELKQNAIVAGIALVVSYLLFVWLAQWSSILFGIVLMAAAGFGVSVMYENFSISTHWKQLAVALVAVVVVVNLCGGKKNTNATSSSGVTHTEHATTAPRHQEKGERKVCYRCNGIGVCGVCNGRGVVPGNMGLSCETCYGKGDCPTCDGKGYTVVTVH